jgi:hypothetical protein
MLQVYKILTEKDRVDRRTWFQMAGEGPVRTRQATGAMNIYKPRTRLDVRSHFFSVRTIDSWNSLPVDIKMTRSVGKFKQLYKQHRSNRTRHEMHQ